MEERLKTLYHLQAINTEIDRIKALRGELPLEVKDMEDQIEGLNTRIRNYSGEIDDLTRRSASEKAKIEEAHDKIAKYKEQLDNVRNNREYDLLTKEIEFQSLEIELAEKHLNEFARIIDTRTRQPKKNSRTRTTFLLIKEKNWSRSFPRQKSTKSVLPNRLSHSSHLLTSAHSRHSSAYAKMPATVLL